MLDDGSIDPDETSETLTRGSLREHAIVLCCAHSVLELVEEVARNLRGLLFEVEVVTGAEARTALLGHGTDAARPTIYVVCVQGTLKEQVLKPLRQALATHGGPNAHLFAAVLDLSLPLAMVGQIRRFAEALGRPRKRKDGLGERRQWREQLGVSTERVATRSYRAIEPLTRDTGSSPAVDAVHRTGPQAVIGSARPAPVGATDKYRAVTGSVPTTPTDSDEVDAETTGVRRQRRTRAPKVRVKALPAKGARRVAEPPPAVTGDTAVARAPTSDDGPARDTVIITPPPLRAELDTPAPAVLPLPPDDADDLVVAPIDGKRQGVGWPVAAAAVVLLAGGVGWWWTTQRGTTPAGNEVAARSAADKPTTRDDRPRDAPVAAPAAGPSAGTSIGAAASGAGAVAPSVSADPTPTGAAPTPTDAAPTAATPTPTDAAPTPTDAAPTPTDAAPTAAGPTPTDAAPTPTDAAPTAPIDAAPAVPTTPTDEPDLEDTSPPAATLPALAEALASRRLRATDRLYVTTERATDSTWTAARAICEAFSIEGVDDFRLPHRRELQMVDIAGFLRDGPHWSRTTIDDDPDSAYVLHASTGQLVVWSKADPAAVVCVRAR